MAGTIDSPPMLLSLPVLVNRFVAPCSGLVVDKNAVVSAVGPVTVSVSEHTYFSSDSVGLRGTWRIGWTSCAPTGSASSS